MSGLVDWLLGVDRSLVEEYGKWEIRWQAMPSAWVVVLILLPLVLLLPGYFYRRENKTASGGSRVALSIIRSGLIAILLALLFQPILYLERSLTKESYLVVLVDESVSMTLRDKYTEASQYEALGRVTGIAREQGLTTEGREELTRLSRLDLVNLALKNPQIRVLDRLKERYMFKAYSFAKGVSPEPPLGAMAVPTEKDRLGPYTQTAIGKAIDSVMKELHGQPVAAIVIITDGRNTADTEPGDIAAQMVDRGTRVPIYTVGVGNPLPPKDISLGQLEAPDVAVAGDFVEFRLKVSSKGFKGESIQVTLTQHDQMIAPLQDLVLEGGDLEVEQEVLIKWKPEKPGEYQLVLSTPVREEELVEDNNLVRHSIRIIDNKIRVLFVEGYPRWEYRYLKNAMVRDKSMLVDVLLYSADESFPQEGSPGRDPLTKFPGELKQLAEYDVVILGDVDPSRLSTGERTSQEVLENLTRFVEELGGGLIMIAGELWAPRMYSDTPIARILPVSVDRSSATSTVVHESLVRIEVTALGRENPILRVAPSLSKEENIELWLDADGKGDGLQGFDWFYRPRSPKAGATVIAQHPTFEVENGNKLPVFCYQRYGRGVCFFSGVQDTWRWRFIRGDSYFYTFWGQVVRHCRSGRLIGSKRFILELDRANYGLNDRVGISARVLDREYEPLVEPTYPMVVTAPGQMPVDLELKAVPNPSSDKRKAGWFTGEYMPTRLGEYELSIGPRGLDDEDERTTLKFSVQEPNFELENPTLDSQTLIKVSEITRGKFLAFYDIEKLPDTIKETGAIVDIETKERDLWDTPLVFLVFALLITAEWVIRKLVRLI
ncbi:MAG: hypothetical protein HUU15_12250 [Candidatus Brocadiae bacterium]|nr:hypothetical protein [Candidatus Brocadiia bacterium]